MRRTGWVVALLAAGAVVVVAWTGCKVDVPDPEKGLFRCQDNVDCSEGFGCWWPTGTSGDGYCTPSGEPVVLCGKTYCADPRAVCVLLKSGDEVCRPGCRDDGECGADRCVAVLSRVGGALVIVGACKTCQCSADICAPLGGGPHHYDASTYCDRTGENCSDLGGDNDRDIARGCEDVQCYTNTPACYCGNLRVDVGEDCDGFRVPAAIPCPSGTTGRPRCTADCKPDYGACTPM